MGLRDNCCPSYFSSQFTTFVSVPAPPSMQVDVITLSVTTESPNERVSIDSMLFTALQSMAAGENYGFQIAFRLFRDTTELALTLHSQLSQVKQLDETVFIDDTVNMTWTDVPGAPGTYTYRITAQRLVEENINFVNVGTRSINAIVFPAVNP